MQLKGPGGVILSICVRDLVGLTHRKWDNAAVSVGLAYAYECAFNNQEEELPPLCAPGGLLQVTHEWRQLFHTWLAEGTAGMSGEQGEEWGKEEKEREQGDGTWICP